MKRQIIEIDEAKCDGCGDCVPECHEGALQIIDDKVRLISDLFCDGLGACIGHCPLDAISIVEREAEPYDEKKVIDKMLVEQPASVLKAHLLHLVEHKATDLLNEAVKYLKIKGISNPLEIQKKESFKPPASMHLGGCPGSMMKQFEEKNEEVAVDNTMPSELRQWPVQLHLVNGNAPYFKGGELVIMCTCGPIANANVHQEYLRDRSVVVACPKLDYTSPYTEKLAEIFNIGNPTKVIIVIMQVPCCNGLIKFATDARSKAEKEGLEIEQHVLALDGSLLKKMMI